MRVKKEEGLTTVAKSLGVAAGIVAAVAILFFAIAGRTTRADDRLQILSNTQLDQVHAAFKVNTSPGVLSTIVDSYRPYWRAYERLYVGSNIFREDAQDVSLTGSNDAKYWQYFEHGGQIGNISVPVDTLVRVYPVGIGNAEPTSLDQLKYGPEPNILAGFFDLCKTAICWAEGTYFNNYSVDPNTGTKAKVEFLPQRLPATSMTFAGSSRR